MKTEEHYEVTIEALFKQAAGNLHAAGFAYAQAYRSFGPEAFWKEAAKHPDLDQGFLVALLMRQGERPMVPRKEAPKPKLPARQRVLGAFMSLSEEDKAWVVRQQMELANELG